jgi:hypothetical protein
LRRQHANMLLRQCRASGCVEENDRGAVIFFGLDIRNSTNYERV